MRASFRSRRAGGSGDEGDDGRGGAVEEATTSRGLEGQWRGAPTEEGIGWGGDAATAKEGDHRF